MKKELRGVQFRTHSGCDYYYDDCSGMCYPCPPGLKDTLLELQSSGPEALDGNGSLTYWENFIRQRHQAYGAFYAPPPSSTDLERPDPARLADIIPQTGMRMLYLIAASQCNLSCRYCIYSDHYPETDQVPAYMSPDIAEKAIDYYLSNLEKKRKRNPAEPAMVIFYGGEPLLNFPLIEGVVRYVQKRGIKNVVYSVTTNGLLLNDKISDFLVENDFSIAISLDGPRSEHDRNRVLPDGSGSFDRVYANIERFWKRHRGYKHLIFLVTHDFASDMNEIRDFFNSRDEFKKSGFFFSRVRDTFTDYYCQFSEEEIKQYKQKASGLKDVALGSAASDDPLVKFGVSGPYHLFLLRRLFGPVGNSEIPTTGTCLPGEKICVLPDGTFQVCERVPGLNKLGSVDTGLDFEAIADLIDLYNRKITNHCAHCPILRLCPFCFSHFWSGKDFEKPTASYCEDQLQVTRTLLTEIYSHLEKDPGLYDSLMSRNNTQYRKLRTLMY